MIKRYLLISSLASLASGAAIAGDLGLEQSLWTKVITVSGGAAYTNPGENRTYQNSTLGFPPNYSYINHSKGQVLGTGELFLAVQRNFPSWLTRLGVEFAGTSPATLKGAFALDGVPITDYQYKISHFRVAAKALVAACPQYWINPYVSGSIGVGWNGSSNFKTNPPVYLVFNDGNSALYHYNSNTSTAVAFTAGLGVNAKVSSNWEVGLGYEFAGWGRSQLSRTQPSSSVFVMPQLEHLYTNTLLFSLSFLYY